MATTTQRLLWVEDCYKFNYYKLNPCNLTTMSLIYASSAAQVLGSKRKTLSGNTYLT